MKVSPKKPFQLVYSLFEHQYLGYLFESFVVEKNEDGTLTFRYQNISSLNAKEFDSGLDETDYELIKLMDSMQQDVVIHKFHNKKLAPSKYSSFFFSVYDKEKGDKTLQEAIGDYLETRRAKILSKLAGKHLYEMANDGTPTEKKIEVQDEKGSILFHFRRNEENTHYFPTLKHKGEKLEFKYKNGIIVCNTPAWLMVDGKLYTFKKEPDGKKIKPFLNKNFIAIPRKMEETYYRKFVAPLIESFDVYAKGFEIKVVRKEPHPKIFISDVASGEQELFFDDDKEGVHSKFDSLLFKLAFSYDKFELNGEENTDSSVKIEKEGEEYTFYKVCRDTRYEEGISNKLSELGLKLNKGKGVLEKTVAFSWLNEHREELEKEGFSIEQTSQDNRKYFIGKSTISIQIKENKDWFDIHAIVKFGDFEIPFVQLRKLILEGRKEFKLPNGEIAIIPSAWLVQYSDLFHFLEEREGNQTLQKYHIALIQELETGNLAKVTLGRKLEKLRNFTEIEDHKMPENFKGELRPYQKAGYNWLKFLNQYNFGGCLADDMGLGKTVQTLAMLLDQKEQHGQTTSLLIMPTSLLYNWEMEAKKFTPSLKVFSYTGTNRDKKIDYFKHFDIILTSYGIARIDTEILEKFYFNYVILDESQVIKNPSSNIAQSVRQLKSSKRLILTGTPLENSTMDLWSQMNFVNPGLLGTQAFFKKEFQLPIEKKKDVDRNTRLHSIIKPFMLRRNKSNVAKDLPPKVEHIKYCEMSEEQEQKYEETKSYYRNQILANMDGKGRGKSQLVLLQGLTMLRQIANHPKMIDANYEGRSGKMRDILYMVENSVEGHQILIFSQFVKHLTIIRKELDDRKIKYAYLDGSVKDRQKQVEKFQKDDNIRIFLISLKAGGVGLNLTAADYVFILDPWWNPAIEAQAIDRAHRIGQDKPVFTYKFITRNSVEEKILALQETKKQLASDLITTEESFVKSLSSDDIVSLLE
jgi:SNF2 family DNA or RNA helicase